MRRVIGAVVAFGVLWAGSGGAQAQDPCATLAAKGAALPGFAGAKADTLKSGNNTICEMYSKDRRSNLKVIVEPAQAAGGVPMRRMLAANAKEPGMKVKEEAGLGNGAFSFAMPQQLSFTVVGKGGVYTVNLYRDAIAPGDEDQVRAIAKQLVEGR